MQTIFSGICPFCKTTLEQISFSDEDFCKMKESIAKHVIEELIYAKTTPQEYERFKQFVAETAPYDIVVDGLNVMLGGGDVGFKTKFDKVLNKNLLLYHYLTFIPRIYCIKHANIS